MKSKELKKILAGVSIAGLMTGLPLMGCDGGGNSMPNTDTRSPTDTGISG